MNSYWPNHRGDIHLFLLEMPGNVLWLSISYKKADSLCVTLTKLSILLCNYSNTHKLKHCSIH